MKDTQNPVYYYFTMPCNSLLDILTDSELNEEQKRGLFNEISNIPIKTGSIIFDKDTSKIEKVKQYIAACNNYLLNLKDDDLRNAAKLLTEIHDYTMEVNENV